VVVVVVGLMMTGEMDGMIGGIYRALAGSESSIRGIRIVRHEPQNNHEG
jgi:hypothetical protein